MADSSNPSLNEWCDCTLHLNADRLREQRVLVRFLLVCALAQEPLRLSENQADQLRGLDGLLESIAVRAHLAYDMDCLLPGDGAYGPIEDVGEEDDGKNVYGG